MIKFQVNPPSTSIGVVETFAESYVRTPARGNAPVSTREAVQAIRTRFPDCLMSDRELADMIARHALVHGRPVIFDSGNAKVEQ